MQAAWQNLPSWHATNDPAASNQGALVPPPSRFPVLPSSQPTNSAIRSVSSHNARLSLMSSATLATARVLLGAIPSLAQPKSSPARHLTDNYAKSPVTKEAFRRKLIEVREELAGPNPSPLESLLAERAAICWLTVNYYEILFAQSTRLASRDAEHHQRRIDAAHRRFLSAAKTLATVRKLALPAIQVNIAEKQVNVVNPS
jgi:hypothetical protein